MVQIAISKKWKDREKEIRSMRSSGSSLATIGEKYGVTRERIRQVLRVLDNRKARNLPA